MYTRCSDHRASLLPAGRVPMVRGGSRGPPVRRLARPVDEAAADFNRQVAELKDFFER